ncbi:amp-CoA ligase [Mycena sp. CBHHK59/15]|nr:amp-CoA ligase [Mycena sp. CBHHK59/15]
MLIPDVVTLNSETNPSGPFYVYLNPESNQIVTITHREFGRATHRAANILCPNGQGPSSRVVAVIALSDTVLYHAILVGLMTADLIPFPISPRNSAAGIFQLLRDSSCHRIVATSVTLESLLTSIKTYIAEVDPEFVLTVEEVPSLAEIYPDLGSGTLSSPFQPFSTQIARAALDDIALYIHSSGSSGLPKTIAQTHRALMQWAMLRTSALSIFHLTLSEVCSLVQPALRRRGIIVTNP